jgi:putative DNA primase/helicase
MATSLDDVIAQMRQVGINLPPRCDLAKAFEGYYRWRPSCEPKAKKSAWARLFEYRSPSGRVFITGSFGWRGDVHTVEASAQAWTPAERAEWLEQRRQAAAAAEKERAKDAETAAQKARRMWDERCRAEGSSEYLDRKKVRAFGVRFLYRGTVVVPLRDMEGTLHGLQYIGADGDKKFGSGTLKEGRFHLIGEISADKPLTFAEGYATAATVHMATGWPVVVCFDAGNLEPVIAQWRPLYPDLKFVIAADDDRHLLERLCERLARVGVSVTPADFSKDAGGLRPMEWELPDGTKVALKAGVRNDASGVARIEGTLTVDGQDKLLKLENAGRARAAASAKKHQAVVLLPVFADRSFPGTDWNDLHLHAGLDACREQLLQGLQGSGTQASAANGAPQGGGKKGSKRGPQPGQEDKFQAFLDRYTLIYGTTTVWDADLRQIIKLESLKAASRGLVDWWLDQVDRRKMVSQDRVVFDPTGECQPPDYVNLYDGLALKPADKADGCSKIVAHLFNLCQENDALFHWVACWLALPLQRPGTKMRTALVLHGRMEGTGKSLMMDVMRKIYGRYARSITQLQLQSEFTGWMSGMLFCVAEEVVSAADRKHHKGLLQNMVTNTSVQINEKNMPVREERSHANFAFLSNDQIPMLLNPTDRRYTVINVETVQPPDYFEAIRKEIEAGGVEAFYRWLLEYEVGDFNEFTRPFENRDRLHLITLGMSPDQRFFEFWRSGLAGVPFNPCTARDLYIAFKAWCKVNGERFVANATQFGRTVSAELERLGASPKKKMRLQCWSEKVIEDGDWSGQPSSYQGIVYLVPGRPADLRKEDEEALQGDAPLVEPGGLFDKAVQRFQEKLHELVRSARRAL